MCGRNYYSPGVPPPVVFGVRKPCLHLGLFGKGAAVSDGTLRQATSFTKQPRRNVAFKIGIEGRYIGQGAHDQHALATHITSLFAIRFYFSLNCKGRVAFSYENITITRASCYLMFAVYRPLRAGGEGYISGAQFIQRAEEGAKTGLG